VRTVDQSRVPPEYRIAHSELQGVDIASLDAGIVEQARQIVYRRHGAAPPAPARTPQMTPDGYVQFLSGIPPQRASLARRHFGRTIPEQVTLENALMILGETGISSQYGVYGDFRSVLMGESIGGNAGANAAGINGVYDPVSGRILAFGNPQNIPAGIRARGREFTLRYDMTTNTITVVRGGENPHLAELNGLSFQQGPRAVPPSPGGPSPGGPRRTTTPLGPGTTATPGQGRGPGSS
jgi:hypothetical protein